MFSIFFEREEGEEGVGGWRVGVAFHATFPLLFVMRINLKMQASL